MPAPQEPDEPVEPAGGAGPVEHPSRDDDRGEVVLVIGAGHEGLVTARALRARGLRDDHVERRTGTGGTGEVDAPGGPMDEAAHVTCAQRHLGSEQHPVLCSSATPAPGSREPAA